MRAIQMAAAVGMGLLAGASTAAPPPLGSAPLWGAFALRYRGSAPRGGNSKTFKRNARAEASRLRRKVSRHVR